MGGGTQVTTQETGPWKGQQKYLLKAFDMAENQFNEVPEYYQQQPRFDAFFPTAGFAKGHSNIGPRARDLERSDECSEGPRGRGLWTVGGRA